MIVDGDEVDEEGRATDEGGKEESRHQHLSDPNLCERFIWEILSSIYKDFLFTIRCYRKIWSLTEVERFFYNVDQIFFTELGDHLASHSGVQQQQQQQQQLKQS